MAVSSVTKVKLSQVKQDCEEIGDKLSGFEDAWHMIRLASTQLLQNVELANNVLVSNTWSSSDGRLTAWSMHCVPFQSVPAAADGHICAAGIVYQPLVHCLRCYSQGKSPL